MWLQHSTKDDAGSWALKGESSRKKGPQQRMKRGGEGEEGGRHIPPRADPGGEEK